MEHIRNTGEKEFLYKVVEVEVEKRVILYITLIRGGV
jgi:hypothetical protein